MQGDWRIIVNAISQDGTMSSLVTVDEHMSATPARTIQPGWVRVMHWTNEIGRAHV